MAASPQTSALGPYRVRFVPAPWVVAALRLVRLALAGRKLPVLGVAGLVWSFAPRKLKLFAAGLTAAALLVMAGSLAAIILLAIQLS